MWGKVTFSWPILREMESGMEEFGAGEQPREISRNLLRIAVQMIQSLLDYC